MVTDLAEVFLLATAKAEENLAFRRYLCAHNYADKPFQILAGDGSCAVTWADMWPSRV